jgi:hypothetical protein
VDGSNVQEFLYVRQDHFQLLPGATNAQRLSQAAAAGAFGPHPVGALVRARGGHSYFFFPLCGDTVSWTTRRLAPVTFEDAQSVQLACPA